MEFLRNIPVVRGLNPYIEKLEKTVSDILIKSIEEQFLNYFLYEFKVEELKKSIKDLEKKRDLIERHVHDEKRKGKDITQDVSDWFQQVENVIHENDKFQQDKRHPYTMCSKGYLPKPGMRYRLAKKAYRLARQVNGLSKTSFSNGVSGGLRPLSIDFLLSVVNFESFESRKQVTEDINKVLKDTTIKTVGVYGMGGVGKTTLVKEVASKLQRDKVFDMVIFATVTRNPDIKQIQGQLADQLCARLEEETEIGRASRLRDIFKNEKKNFLVILDDLWAELDLNKLGIPVDDVNLTPKASNEVMSGEAGTSIDGQATKEASGGSKMLKILLTSRNKEVVFDKMHVKENAGFLIKGLEDKEALIWFKKMVGNKPPEFGPLAAKISNKCGGLPIVIVTIGGTLRTKSYSQWKETLDQLDQQEFTEVAESMNFSTRLSFNYLETEKLKSTFLLCAQLGYHPLITDLVKYCIGMGIFEGFLTIKETREKVLQLLEKLKDSSLLSDSYSDDRFNMHDMTRESALSILYEERNFLTMQNEEIKEWPNEKEFKKYNGIYIHNCDIYDKLPNFVSCPRLEIFHVRSLDPSFRIPGSFFQRASQLKAFILTGIDVSNFCASIGCLTNLRMLCLEKCKLGDMSFIGKLEKLRIVSLSGSKIENLPTELGQLHKLQLLDMSNCSELEEIPPNVLSRLTSLEELYMRNSVKWKSEENQSEDNILTELRHLHQLKIIDICIPNAVVLPRNLFLHKLDSYKIVIGDFEKLFLKDFKMPVKDEASRVLALQVKERNGIHYQMALKILFRGVEKMVLGELNGVKSIFSELNLEGFPCLKELFIADNSVIKCIIDPKKLLNLYYVFPILEYLHLYRLENMMEIVSHMTNLSGASFSRLKVVKIHCCGGLKSIFSLSMALLLKNLESIDISDCKSVKTILLKEEPDEKKIITFPKLRSLALSILPSFIGLYCNDQDPNNGNIIFNEQVEIPNLEMLEMYFMHMKEIRIPSKSFENLTKLQVVNCQVLRYVFSFSMAKSMKKLKWLSINRCWEMKEIFNYGNEDDHETREICVFPKLEEIHVDEMFNLKTIWPANCSPDSFPSLKSMNVEWCNQLVTVFPSHMAGRFSGLEILKVSYCDKVVQIFDLNGVKKTGIGDETQLQVLQLAYLRKLKSIWNEDPQGILNFKMVRSVMVGRCRQLEYLFPASVAKGLQELESLSISDVIQMEEIVHKPRVIRGDEVLNDVNFEFPQVSVVEMKSLPNLKYFYKGRHNVKWPKLKKLSLFGCHDELEAFKTETGNSQGAPIFLLEEIVRNLETLEINLEEVEKLKLNIEKHCMNHLKNFLVVSCPSTKILYEFLYRMPYLDKLTLLDCDELDKVIPIQENIGSENLEIHENICTFLQIKYLILKNMSALENIRFERDPVLQYCLEHLHIAGCRKLINLGPSSVSFTHLTTLEVHRCWGMKNLMGFSTARSMVQLVFLKVTQCQELENIVTWQDDEVKVKYRHEIAFSKLKTLQLIKLPRLSCFLNFENYGDSFKFPSLEKLVVTECPMMTKFCNGICTAPNLQVIRVQAREENWSWKGDLNDRMLTMVLSSIIFLSLSDYPELEYIWHGKTPLPDYTFINLGILVVENCDFLSSVIPSHLLIYLTRLLSLNVRRCRSVVSIFDMNCEESVGSFNMETMILDHLPNMKHIWSNNPEGILAFERLRRVEVTDCDSVQSLFPAASIPKSVTALGIKNCGALEEIVGNVEAYDQIELPCLSYLHLSELPKLKAGSTKFRCANLIYPTVYDCGEFTKSQIFSSQSQESYEGSNANDKIGTSNESSQCEESYEGANADGQIGTSNDSQSFLRGKQAIPGSEIVD